MDGFGTRVISGMVARVQVDDFIIALPRTHKALFAEAGRGDSESEHATNRGGLHTSKPRRPAADRVGGDSALAICRAGKRDHTRLARDEIENFDRVSHGPNLWIAGLHRFVDL